MTPEAAAGVTGDVRWLICALPRPPVTKNERIGWMKGGRRFLVPSAREYRSMVKQLVAPILPERPWFRHGWEVDLSLALVNAVDVDHYVSGLLDDLVEAGLHRDDRECVSVRIEKYPPNDRDTVYVFAREVP